MRTSIATVSISGELPEKPAAIAAAGFDGIEIFEQDVIADDGRPREVGRRVRDHGLEIMLFQPLRDFEGLPYGDGFFFEIVQRSGGDRGYGATDAPFRIAALKRLLRAGGGAAR